MVQNNLNLSKEQINSINSVEKNNFDIFNKIDKKNFTKLIESFGNEKESNKALLSKFLTSQNVHLSQLGDLKIDINNIKNYIRNKPDISKDLETKIAKLYLKNLYESGKTNIPFMKGIKQAFDIENETDIENKNIDFKTIQVNIQKIQDTRNEKINCVSVSNNEIFDLLGNDINKYATFQTQNLSSQPLILDLLQFEVKGVINHAKTWGENVEKDIEYIMAPSSAISNIFDKVKDPEIEELIIQKGKTGEENKEETNEINKMIWGKYIENFEKTGMDKGFISVIKKLVQNNFNFAQLDKTEQTILRKTLIVDNIDLSENKRANYADLDQNEFKDFMQNLYDFGKEDINLNIEGRGKINLKIKKEVKNGTTPKFSDVESFKKMGTIQPIVFTVNIDDNDKNIIEDLESEGDNILRKNGIMETHITKSGPITIGNGYELEICGKIITKSQLDELLNCDYDDEKLNKILEKLGLLNELKDLVSDTKKNIDTNNSNKNSKDKGYKSCIFEEILKKLDIKITKRNLIFDGENINKLSQLYILSKLGSPKKIKDNDFDKEVEQALKFNYGTDTNEEELGGKEAGEFYGNKAFNQIKVDFEEFNPEDQAGEYGVDYTIIQEDTKNSIAEDREKLNKEGKEAFTNKLSELTNNEPNFDENIGSEIENLIYDLESNNDETNSDIEEPNHTETIVEPPEEATEKTEEEKIKEARDSFPGDKDALFEKGTRIYANLGESKLPPQDISDATKSYFCFEISDIGDTTFTLNPIGGELQFNSTKKYTLPKTAEQLEKMTSGGDIYKVRPRNQKDWDYCLESVNKAGFFKKFTTFGNMEGQVKLKGNKFVNEKGEEIKYFDRVEGIFDNSDKDTKKRGQGEKIYKYEIKKIDTGKGTVKIASTFDGYDKDKDYAEVKYEYENEIPFEQFILLMEGKRLKGYTQEQQKEMETKYSIDDPKRLANKGMRHRLSIGSILNVFKNTKKAIQGKIDAKKKEQEEFLENYLYSYEGLNLYGKLEGLFGGLGLSSLEDAVAESKYEFYTNRENRTWKQIEKWYKIFDSDPNYPELFNEHLKDILAQPGYRGDDKDRYKFAAALLKMVKQEGPYPRDFTTYKDKGLWVEKLLGPEHKTRFLNFYEKKKNALEQEKDMGNQSGVRLAMQEELNKMEMQYIISVIDGRAPYGQGSNEFMLKSIWSTKFLGELETNLNGYFNKHEDEKGKMETFYAAEEQYLRTAGAGRFNKALPALERMCEMAKTKGEVFRAKGYILSAMLMGIIKNNATSKTIKSFWGTCRSMGFTPGYWMRDVEQQDKVQILLDGITNGNFSKDTKFNIANFTPGQLTDAKYSYIKTFQGYWNSHGRNILDKLERPGYKNGNNDKSIIDLANEKDNPNNYVFKDIIKNSTTNEIDKTNPDIPPIFSQESPLTATSNMIEQYIPNGGRYGPKNPEDISNCEDFRKNLNACLPIGKSDKETTEFLFKKYFNWFNTKLDSNYEKIIVRSIPRIQEEKSKGNETEARFMLWYMLKGILHDTTRGSFPPDFENVANKFVNFFYENIDLIDKSVIKATFSDKEIIDSFDNPFIMLNWGQFMQYNMRETKGTISQGKNVYNTLITLNHINDEDIINKKIDHIRSNIHNKCSVPKLSEQSHFGKTFNTRIDRKELNKMKEDAEKAYYDDIGLSA